MNAEPKSCALCSGPLAPDSVDGICPACARTRHTAAPGDTLRPTATAEPVARIKALPLTGSDEAPLPKDLPGLEPLRRLGVGGMGAVYLARDTATGREVAVKLLNVAGDDVALKRFRAEVRALAELRHPHIVTVFAADFDHTPPHYTMEYAVGGTLSRSVAAHGPLDPRAAAELVAAVAGAAHAAHERGIVHRDIKPGNVLLDVAPGGARVPKLSDFGLAKRADSAERITVGSAALGTPHFMAPEQAAGAADRIAPHTDVYGLGATLYFALTGRAPFEDENLGELLAHVRSAEPVSVRTLRAEVPPELEAIVHKCLEKNPVARYTSAAALAADLTAFASGGSVAAPVLTPVRRARKAIARNRRALVRVAVGAGALVAVFALGVVLTKPDPKPDQPSDPKSDQKSDQKPDAAAYERVRADLLAGKPVVLVGESGNPVWHDWIHGSGAFAPVRVRGGACSYQTFGPTVLDLWPDPLTDRYRVRAELAQLDVNDGAGGTATRFYQLGLYFGRKTATGNNGWRVDVCLGTWHTEVSNAAGNARFARVMVADAPVRRPDVGRNEHAITPFAPAPLPGPWRTVEAEVTPDGVRVWFDGAPAPFVDANVESVARWYAEPYSALDRLDPAHGVVLPPWTPRGALGVWSYDSTVAVRNVTLTPLK